MKSILNGISILIIALLASACGSSGIQQGHHQSQCGAIDGYFDDACMEKDEKRNAEVKECGALDELFDGQCRKKLDKKLKKTAKKIGN